MTELINIIDFYTTLFKNTASLNADVFYGDQTKIVGPRTICLEPSGTEREVTRAASARAVKKTFSFYVFVYANRVIDKHANRRESDELTTSVVALIDTHPTCGGLVFNTLIVNSESGYVNKGSNTTIAANRLSITCQSEEILPASVE